MDLYESQVGNVSQSTITDSSIVSLRPITKSDGIILTLLNNYKRLIHSVFEIYSNPRLHPSFFFVIISIGSTTVHNTLMPFHGSIICTQHSRCMHKIILPKRKISKDH